MNERKATVVSMAAGSDAVKFIGDRKRDLGSKFEFAELVLRMENMRKSRDRVDVLYPTDSTVRVLINDVVIIDRRLPAPVITNQCKFKVSYKEKGKITLKMRKLEATKWVDRWSPRREQIGNDDDVAAATGGSGQPTVTPPSDDDDDDDE